MKPSHKRKIQEMLKIGFSKKTLSLMTESQVTVLLEKLKKSETKEVLNVKKGSPEEKDAMSKGVAFNTYEEDMKETKKNKKKIEKNPWAICTTSLGLEGKKKDDYTKKEKVNFEKCVMGVKKKVNEGKNPVEYLIESKMEQLIEKHLSPKMTKGEMLKLIENKKRIKLPIGKLTSMSKSLGEDTKTAPAPVKTPTTTPKKTPSTPFRPKPGVQPKPKAGKKRLPDYLKFDELNIKFKD
jgi:hypothetical protein